MQVCDYKQFELGKLEHQISVVLLSDPSASSNIEQAQHAIKKGATDFNAYIKSSTQVGIESSESDKLYQEVSAQILTLKVLSSGNELVETIEQLIEINQQITLDLNEADHDTSQGVEIEEKLDALANQIEETQESAGFLSEQDIKSTQTEVIGLIGKIANQEKARDAIVISRQVKSEAEETCESFDQLAALVTTYFKLKQQLV